MRITMKREYVLKSAQSLIAGERHEEYGNALDNFERICAGWEVIFGCEVKPYQVALAMDWVKTSRLVQTPDSHDGWIDKAGYAALGGEVSDEEAE